MVCINSISLNWTHDTNDYPVLRHLNPIKYKKHWEEVDCQKKRTPTKGTKDKPFQDRIYETGIKSRDFCRAPTQFNEDEI
jgi:hypothetical protein